MRDPRDLEKNALLFWPSHIAASEAESSIIPRLIETQEQFIGLLLIANKSPFAWKEALEVTKTLTPNLFLKHLMVLADIGGEKTQRIYRELESISGSTLEFVWHEQNFSYKYQSHKNGSWTNDRLNVVGKNLMKAVKLNPAMEDVANFILFAEIGVLDQVFRITHV